MKNFIRVLYSFYYSFIHSLTFSRVSIVNFNKKFYSGEYFYLIINKTIALQLFIRLRLTAVFIYLRMASPARLALEQINSRQLAEKVYAVC